MADAAEIRTVYADRGAPQLRTRQFATMLFADAARTHWIAVHPTTLNEGEIVEDSYSRPTRRVTWEGREKPGTIDEEWQKLHAPQAAEAA